MQAGYVGLLKAINNFDPDYGDSLMAYARPCVSGEIKRHFRDKRWPRRPATLHPRPVRVVPLARPEMSDLARKPSARMTRYTAMNRLPASFRGSGAR